MKHVISLSGGRTSTGPLPLAVIERFGVENVELIFCDTGAEHDDTYRFIRDAEADIGVKITCLKLILPKESGVGARYRVCTTDDICRDYYAWKQNSHKYGNPFFPSGKICTDQMKTQIFKKYCADAYGKGNFYTWIGYRVEEGNRIWGKDASNALGKLGMTNTEKTEFYLSCVSGNIDDLLSDHYPEMFPDESDDKQKDCIKRAFNAVTDKNFRFMPEVSLMNKGDVIASWKMNPKDLKIEEHLTNCIFCGEKPDAVVMLAIKDEPEAALEFLSVVESEEVPVKVKRDGTVRSRLGMYRGEITFRQLYDKAMSLPRKDILIMSRMGQKLAKKNPCSSGECSPFGDIHDDQPSLF